MPKLGNRASFFKGELVSDKEHLTKCAIEGVYWNKETNGIEIHFSSEDTPQTYLQDRHVYFHDTADGRTMKIEIRGLAWHR